MKKTLIAIAAIAAAGASFAGTTVYGKLDAGVFNTPKDGTSVGLSGFETSRFGIKGEETVGGLTLSAVLEAKVNDDKASKDGQAAVMGFDRTATVGVSGSFGTITIGNQWTPFDGAAWTSDALEYAIQFTPLQSGLWKYDVGNTQMGNAKNSVQYATPVISGFQAFVLSAPNVSGNVQGAANYTGYGINYANGPLVINFATQAYSTFPVTKDNVTTTHNETVNSSVLAVNYDFGMAKAYGGYFNTDSGLVATGKDTGFTVGVAVPFGADSLRLGYGTNKTSFTNGTADSSSSAWSAMYMKPLTKAALGYAALMSKDAVNTTGVGIRYNF